mgnify:CR=1 FL=1
MQREKPREIDVSAIHDVDCARLRQKEIEHVHVMQLAVLVLPQKSGPTLTMSFDKKEDCNAEEAIHT